tara:strand:+ start:94 stop:1002 length:909 start_codon:yes stop_codon:yes gene_type:complete
MPKKSTNLELLLEYIESVQDKISEQTRKTYTQISKSLPFNVLTTQPTIIKKLNSLYENPNTKSLYLNMIILLRRKNNQPTDKLIKFRNSLRDVIIQTRKNKMTEIKDKLPSYSSIILKLKELKGLEYIINYLLINFGFRNKDLNLKYVSKVPESKEDENYLIHKKNKVMLNINDYKTDKSFGEKNIIIEDKKFKEELKSLKLNENDYLMSKKNGEKLKSSSLGEKVMKLSINNLGEAKMFKILIGHLLDTKDFNKIEELVKSRGTSMSTILKSYNIYSNNDKNSDDKVKEIKEDMKEETQEN